MKYRKQGKIIRYVREKRLGFIEVEDGTVAFFLFDMNMHHHFVRNGGNPKHQFTFGDELEFDMMPSLKKKNKWEAHNLMFIRNARIEMLLQDATENETMRGYIKQLNNGKLMIKHAISYVFIPLDISGWETDIDQVYTQRIDEIVDFKLTQTQNIYALKAVVTDAKFMQEYSDLIQIQQKEEVIQAALVDKNSDGYFATILNGKVEAFISIPAVLNPTELRLVKNLKRGDSLPVTIKNIYPNKKVSLRLSV